jgi:WD domain, G-beta repeat
MNTASAVLVLWTKDSINSEFVYGEAMRGRARGALVAAAFDNLDLVDLPVPFGVVQTANLSDWIETGASSKHQEWQGVLEVLGRMLDRPALAEAAAIIEKCDEQDKRDFLRRYPTDLCSIEFAREIELKEREAFEQEMRSAEAWVKETEDTLKTARAEFESSLADLPRGQPYNRPKLASALQENPVYLLGQIENLKETVAREKQRASADAAILKQESDRSIDGYKSRLDSLEVDLQEKAAVIAATSNELEQLRAATQRADQDLLEKDQRIQDLKNQNNTIKPDSYLSKHSGFVALAASVVALLGGIGLGRVLIPESYSLPVPIQSGLDSRDEDALAEREATVTTRENAVAERETSVTAREIAVATRGSVLAAAGISPPLPVPKPAEILAPACGVTPSQSTPTDVPVGANKSIAIIPIMAGTNRLRTAAISPDGTKIAAAGEDRIIRVWDAYTLKPIGQPLAGHTGAVYSLDFWRDGSLLASASWDGTVRIWNSAEGSDQARRTISCRRHVHRAQ